MGSFSQSVIGISGGSSDFSIANVTFVNDTGSQFPLGCAAALDADEIFEGDPAYTADMYMFPLEIGQTITLKIPLYKGNALVNLGDSGVPYDPEISGDISLFLEGLYLVTGDGEITLNEPK